MVKNRRKSIQFSSYTICPLRQIFSLLPGFISVEAVTFWVAIILPRRLFPCLLRPGWLLLVLESASPLKLYAVLLFLFFHVLLSGAFSVHICKNCDLQWCLLKRKKRKGEKKRKTTTTKQLVILIQWGQICASWMFFIYFSACSFGQFRAQIEGKAEGCNSGKGKFRR